MSELLLELVGMESRCSTCFRTSGCTCRDAGHRSSSPRGRLHGVLQVNRGRQTEQRVVVVLANDGRNPGSVQGVAKGRDEKLFSFSRVDDVGRFGVLRAKVRLFRVGD